VVGSFPPPFPLPDQIRRPFVPLYLIPFAIRSYDLFILLTTHFTSFDVYAFDNLLENISPFMRGNTAGAQTSQGPFA
jgi:hypothetical protein